MKGSREIIFGIVIDIHRVLAIIHAIDLIIRIKYISGGRAVRYLSLCNFLRSEIREEPRVPLIEEKLVRRDGLGPYENFDTPFYRVPLYMEEPNSGDAGDGSREWGIHGVGFFSLVMRRVTLLYDRLRKGPLS